MKRYIKSESYRRREFPNYQAWSKAIKRDIRNVAACQNEEDLANLKLTSGNSDYEKRIWNERFEKQGVTDFDEKIDLIIDWLYDSANYVKETANRYSEEIKTADAVINKIMTYMESVPDYCYSFDSVDSIFEIEPMDGADLSRSSLQQFIDNLLEALGGKYYGTGRGGSWTSWNILIDGIEFQIGPSDNGTCWILREV